MAPPTEDSKTPEIEIILDTNILQYYSVKEMRPSLQSFFQEFSKSKKIVFSISQVSITELLSGATIVKETQALEQIKTIKQYNVDQGVLVATARLKNLYCIEHIPDQQITLGDRIIAATSILTGNPILTANVNDFPRPYFIEVFRHLLTYEKKSSTQTICLQILKPDIRLIAERFNHRK